MIEFESSFLETMGEPVEYKGMLVSLVDRYPVVDGDVLILSIESTASETKQGFFVDVTGHCEIDGHEYRDKKGKGVEAFFWEDTMPKTSHMKLITKKNHVLVGNVWKQIDHMGNAFTDYGHFGSAMIVEEIENGRRYKCNDWHPDDDFDDIVFTIKTLKKKS